MDSARHSHTNKISHSRAVLRHQMSCLAFLIISMIMGCNDSPTTESTSTEVTKVPLAPRSVHSVELSVDGEVTVDSVPMEKILPGGGADSARLLPDIQQLIPGDAAPPLTISKWAKGDAIPDFEPGKVYVVEFWATWCGPCRQGMPHLSQLQDQYGDQVSFVGVTDEDLETVQEFLEQKSPDGRTWNDVITYRIALDDLKQTNATYMVAAGQGGIPTAFIVGQTGVIEWIGHPARMDDVLQQVVERKWDVQSVRNDFLQTQAEDAALMPLMPVLRNAMSSGETSEAVNSLNKILESIPDSDNIRMLKLQILLCGKDQVAVSEHATELMQHFNDDADMLNQVAWLMATLEDGRTTDLNIALAAAKRASELTQNNDASIIETLARVYAEQKNWPEAVKWQKKAVELAPDQADYQQSLVQYEAEVAKATGGQ